MGRTERPQARIKAYESVLARFTVEVSLFSFRLRPDVSSMEGFFPVTLILPNAMIRPYSR